MGNLMVQNILPHFFTTWVCFLSCFFFFSVEIDSQGDKSMFLQCEASGMLGISELSAAKKKIKLLLAKAYFTFS